MKSTKYIVLLMLAAGIFSACSDKNVENTAFSADPVEVVLSKPQQNTQAGQLALSGVAESEEQASISTRMMGTIDKIYVNIGDRVRKGQALVSLNAFDVEAKRQQVQAQINLAEVALSNAQKDYDRFTALYESNSATEKEMDNIGLQYAQAKSQLTAAKEMMKEVDANMQYAKINAPFDGIITQKLSDEGSMANPGMPVLMMEGEAGLRIKATVSEKEIGFLKKDQKATVYFSATGKELEGKINRISSSSVSSGGQYVLEISLEDAQASGVKPGMYAHAFVETKSIESQVSNSLLVPEKALVHKDELTGIYTVSQNGTALLRWVRTGRSFGGFVEVLSGLTIDEQFVETSSGRLYNGVPLQVK